MGQYLYWKRYFGETPKGTITKFDTKKRETLGYFPFPDCMAPSSAILELFASKSPINVGSKLPDGFQRWGTNHQISGHDSPIICAEQFYVEVSKNCTAFE